MVLSERGVLLGFDADLDSEPALRINLDKVKAGMLPSLLSSHLLLPAQASLSRKALGGQLRGEDGRS